MKMLSWLTYPHVVPNLHEFLFSKEDILKNVGNKTVFVSYYVNVYHQLFGSQHSSHYLCVCVQQKK